MIIASLIAFMILIIYTLGNCSFSLKENHKPESRLLVYQNVSNTSYQCITIYYFYIIYLKCLYCEYDIFYLLLYIIFILLLLLPNNHNMPYHYYYTSRLNF